ncbi:unnamed protein product [Ceratitis capitata]|uniref:(Mediterranean fruit fly) hypothetical protein n=1 Tax=Ceratitis capitata TaxID=7213 RepID=A0A811UKQ1_CERCA|nr:unnamed protein product [Ceratitis capitata]
MLLRRRKFSDAILWEYFYCRKLPALQKHILSLAHFTTFWLSLATYYLLLPRSCSIFFHRQLWLVGWLVGLCMAENGGKMCQRTCDCFIHSPVQPNCRPVKCVAAAAAAEQALAKRSGGVGIKTP